jgi:methyl-accepting chemotaxis protein
MIVGSFRNLGILQKIMTIAVVSVFLVALTLLLYILPMFERKIMEEKKLATRHVVEVAFRAVEVFGEKARSGEMPLADAQAMAKQQVRGMRYQGQEYFWINDLLPRMIMHPAKPELDGKDLRGHKDPQGKFLFVEFAKIARESGAGFVDYLWSKPDSSEPVPKISYVKLYKPWGWIIGSGIYVDDVQKDMALLRWTVVGITFSLSVFMLVLAFLVGLGITRPLNKVVASLDDISHGEGDLTQRLDVKYDDESGALARSFNQMNEKLVGIVRQIHASSEELARINSDILCVSKQGVYTAKLQSENVMTTVSAVTEIDSSLKEISRNVNGLSAFSNETNESIQSIVWSIDTSGENVEQLKHYVDEVTASLGLIALSMKTVSENVATLYNASVTTATSVAQMDSASRQVQRNAGRSAETVAQVLLDAQQGKESVDATIEGIRQIHDAARITADVICSLTGRVDNIGSILTVISEVTNQTHLLSLNASIIAAQAGIHGKGFAVVASEVKDLAEKTRVSTQKIDAVIQSVQSEARQALNAMKRAEKCIQEGSMLSHRSGEALEKIVDGVESVREQTDIIATAMDEQAAGSQVIHRAMEQVSLLVSQSVSAIREQELAVENITGAAGNMHGLAREVYDSTLSQNKSVKQIAAANLNVITMIAHIKGACDEQNTGSGYIINAIENIRDSADSNLQSMLTLDQSIEQLVTQIELLESQIGKFRT